MIRTTATQVNSERGRPFKLAVLNSHPIQYFAPLYRRLAALPDVELTVYYCSRQSTARGFADPGFNREVIWDVQLLDGYDHVFLKNLGGERGVVGFLSLVNLDIVPALWRERHDALVVHGHAYFTNLLAIAAARLRGTAVFMRGESNLLLTRSRLRRMVRYPALRGLYRMCTAFLYIGRLNREFYLHFGVPDRNLFFVPYTVDNERFRAEAESRTGEAARVRESLGISPEATVVLYASKLIARKRAGDLLEVHRRLLATPEATELLVVGDGPALNSLRAEVSAKGMPRVHFMGFRNQSELPDYYAAANILVLPAEDEPWGLVINEAMAAGVPVVTTDRVGAAADLIRNGVTGFTYPVGDLDMLQGHIARLAASPELRRLMSANCREMMRSWSYDQCVSGILEALQFTSRRPSDRG